MPTLRLSKSTINRHAAASTNGAGDNAVAGSESFTCSTFSCLDRTNACQQCGTVIGCTL
jgi:hypothetical protein